MLFCVKDYCSMFTISNLNWSHELEWPKLPTAQKRALVTSKVAEKLCDPKIRDQLARRKFSLPTDTTKYSAVCAICLGKIFKGESHLEVIVPAPNCSSGTRLYGHFECPVESFECPVESTES